MTSKCLPGVELSIVVCDWDCDRNTILCSGMDIQEVQGMATYPLTLPAIYLFIPSVNVFWILNCEPSIEAGILRDAKEVEVTVLGLMAGISPFSPLNIGLPQASVLCLFSSQSTLTTLPVPEL